MTLYASRSAADAAAERLKTYAQPQRLMILSRLIDGEHTVSEIDEATGIGQPEVQHMPLSRQAYGRWKLSQKNFTD